MKFMHKLQNMQQTVHLHQSITHTHTQSKWIYIIHDSQLKNRSIELHMSLHGLKKTIVKEHETWMFVTIGNKMCVKTNETQICRTRLCIGNFECEMNVSNRKKRKRKTETTYSWSRACEVGEKSLYKKGVCNISSHHSYLALWLCCCCKKKGKKNYKWRETQIWNGKNCIVALQC